MTRIRRRRSVIRRLWLLLLAIAVVAPALAAGGNEEPDLIIYAIPSSDGREVWVRANMAGGTGTPVAVICDVGCRVMGCDASGCTVALTGFTPGITIEGLVSMTVVLSPTQTLETGPLPFIRAYAPATTPQSIHSVDGNLELTLVSTDTIAFDTYIAIIPGGAPPGPAPYGHRFAGSVYSVRASGALVETDKPMILRLYYDETTLAGPSAGPFDEFRTAFRTGADPHTLAIFAWDAFDERWVDLGGRLFDDTPEGHFLSVATSRFTTYALMTTPTWRDAFDDFSGLNLTETSNVALYPQEGSSELVLLSRPGSGIAVSRPITPTTPIASWGSLVFTGTVDPPTTTLTVDVLSPDGTELLTDVTSGTSLAGIDPAQHPGLKLRANLSSTVAGETPALDEWRLTWLLAVCYDANEDGEVDPADIQAVAGHWSMDDTHEGWDRRFDLDNNGVVNIVDIMRVAVQWGAGCQ